MATSTDEIYIKMKVDTTAFDGSLRGMKREMMTLKGMIGSNLISKQDELLLKSRFGAIKDEMEDVSKASANIATKDVFGNLARFAGVAANAVAGLTAGMSLLGVKDDEVGKIQMKIMQFMAIGNAMQALADADRLKSLALIYAAKVKEFFLGKEMIAQDVTKAATQAAGPAGAAPIARDIAQGVSTVAQVGTAATVSTTATVAQTTALAALNSNLIAYNANLVVEQGEIAKETGLLEINTVAIEKNNAAIASATATNNAKLSKLQQKQKLLEVDKLMLTDDLKTNEKMAAQSKANIALTEAKIASINKGTVATAANTTTLGTNTVATGANSAGAVAGAGAWTIFTGAIGRAAAAVKAFTISLLLNPIFQFIALMTAVAVVAWKAGKALAGAGDEFGKYNESVAIATELNKEFQASITGMVGDLKDLADKLLVVNGRMTEDQAKRNAAQRKYNEEYTKDADKKNKMLAKLNKQYTDDDEKKNGVINNLKLSVQRNFDNAEKVRQQKLNADIALIDATANKDKIEKEKKLGETLNATQLKTLEERKTALKAYEDAYSTYLDNIKKINLDTDKGSTEFSVNERLDANKKMLDATTEYYSKEKALYDDGVSNLAAATSKIDEIYSTRESILKDKTANLVRILTQGNKDLDTKAKEEADKLSLINDEAYKKGAIDKETYERNKKDITDAYNAEIIALTKKFNLDKATIESNGSKESEENLKAEVSSKSAINKKYIDEVFNQYNAKLALLNRSLSESFAKGINFDEYNKGLDEFIKRRNELSSMKKPENLTPEEDKSWIENQKKSLDELNSMATGAREQMLSVVQSTLGTLSQFVPNAFQNTYANVSNLMSKIATDTKVTTADIINTVGALANDIMNSVFGSLTQRIEETQQTALTKLQEQFDNADSQLTKLKDRKIVSDAEYNKRKEALDKKKAAEEKAIKKKAFEETKQLAIIQAVINTALGITGALASSGTLTPLGAAIAAVLIGIAGAAEIATISSQQAPEFAKGGLVPYKALGGMLNGPSHQQGGIPLVAEGGEFIIRKSIAQRPGMPDYLNKVNQGQTQTQVINNTLDPLTLKMIVAEVVSGTRAIPVNVIETDITKTQRKVSSIESRSTWVILFLFLPNLIHLL
jgi:hypothetical protein